MWQKLKEQLPAIILTAALILGIAFWFNQKMAADMAAKQRVISASVPGTSRPVKLRVAAVKPSAPLMTSLAM